MEITGVLPTRSQSKRTRSSNSSRSETTSRGDRGTSTQTQSSISSTSTPIATSRTTPTLPRSSRPSILSRTNSAPLVPLSKGSRIETVDEDDSDAYNPRDSVAVSIKDDPFFRNYQTPNSESLARQLRTATYANSMHGEDTLEPPPRSSKRPSVDHSAPLPPQSRSGMADINIAIIGSGGVGKSTLIQRALGLRSLPTSIPSSQRMYVDNVVYMVSLIELDLESFDIISERRVQWPKQINGHIVPRMDGALLLYDVMNRDSIAELPQTLNALVTSALPTILVSCKCDNPESSRQIDVESMESACLQCVEAVKTAANVPESARLCLSAILKHVLANRIAPLNNPDTAGPRRRANSSAYLETPSNENGRPLSQHSKHSRASSEFSTLIAFPSPTLRGQPGASRNPTSRTNLHNQFKLPSPDEAPPLSAHPAFRLDGSQGDPDSEQQTNPIPSPGLAKAIDNAFLDIEESDADSSNRYSDDIPILQRNDDGYFDKPSKVAGISFEELVDRLLSQNMSRADSNFSDIFLCLYRMFAAPGELFAAILNRLERIADDKNTHYLTRTAAQLRIVTVVAKWVSSYPGDFASSTTSRNLDNFINNLATEPVFAAAASEMRGQLQSRVVVDDDTGWARTDADVDNEQNGGSESVPSSPVRQRTHASTEFSEEMSNLNVDDDEGGGEIERQQSGKDSSSSARAASPTQSVSLSFDTVEDYEKEAATMVPRMTLPLTKFRYHIFMDTSDDDIADEMTRIDWVMFSSIRLRDLVRHVSLPLELKAKSKSLANVNRMINHFNHIAKWVANMILMRDKPKHRAQMLEKFMAIALKLRQLNNYNSLAAVLAGINGSAIYRLNQTRALVPAEVHKRFYRLVMLMSPQKSHFSYRLAWENSSLPRIPFIPLTRRDLVSAEEGSRTFVGANGERINWKKFEVLSEVILPIMKSQVVPYPNLKKHDIARELILDCRILTDDEEIYQRSVQFESPASGAVEPGKKKFPWFSK